MHRRLLLLVALALALGACGGGGGRGGAVESGTGARPPATTTPSAVDSAQARVVRAWADALRHGHVAAAAAYFALPAVVANGSRPLRLATRATVRVFNRSLPCGARLIATEPTPHRFLVATFRLTERPGAGECGSGTGRLARVAIRVRDGRITYWLRIEDVPRTMRPVPATPGTQV
ncbi:MAG TPA: hypothetical protein VKB25_15475 [Conexibacter sp.]|nr:hypothetical protein [Conexibacter sp.]